MTAWAAPGTWIVGAKLLAATLNTQVRDNFLYVKEVLAGTNTDKIADGAFANNSLNGSRLVNASVTNTQLATGIDGAKVSAGTIVGTSLASPLTIPGKTNFVNDANFSAEIISSDTYLTYDTNDRIGYARSTNVFNFLIASAVALAINATGKLTGLGFYDSGEVSVTNGSTQGFATGFGSGGGGVAGEGPRFVWGLYGTSSGTNINQPVAVYQSAGATCKFTTMSNTTINVNNATGATQIVRVWAITNV